MYYSQEQNVWHFLWLLSVFFCLSSFREFAFAGSYSVNIYAIVYVYAIFLFLLHPYGLQLFTLKMTKMRLQCWICLKILMACNMSVSGDSDWIGLDDSEFECRCFRNGWIRQKHFYQTDANYPWQWILRWWQAMFHQARLSEHIYGNEFNDTSDGHPKDSVSGFWKRSESDLFSSKISFFIISVWIFVFFFLIQVLVAEIDNF